MLGSGFCTGSKAPSCPEAMEHRSHFEKLWREEEECTRNKGKRWGSLGCLQGTASCLERRRRRRETADHSWGGNGFLHVRDRGSFHRNRVDDAPIPTADQLVRQSMKSTPPGPRGSLSQLHLFMHVSLFVAFGTDCSACTFHHSARIKPEGLAPTAFPRALQPFVLRRKQVLWCPAPGSLPGGVGSPLHAQRAAPSPNRVHIPDPGCFFPAPGSPHCDRNVCS